MADEERPAVRQPEGAGAPKGALEYAYRHSGMKVGRLLITDSRMAGLGRVLGRKRKAATSRRTPKGSIILRTGMSRGTSKTGLVGEARSVAEASTTAEAIRVRIERLDWEDV